MSRPFPRREFLTGTALIVAASILRDSTGSIFVSGVQSIDKKASGESDLSLELLFSGEKKIGDDQGEYYQVGLHPQAGENIGNMALSLASLRGKDAVKAVQDYYRNDPRLGIKIQERIDAPGLSTDTRGVFLPPVLNPEGDYPRIDLTLEVTNEIRKGDGKEVVHEIEHGNQWIMTPDELKGALTVGGAIDESPVTSGLVAFGIGTL